MIEEERAEIEARSKETEARYQSMDNDRWNILGLVFRNLRRKSNMPTYTLVIGSNRITRLVLCRLGVLFSRCLPYSSRFSIPGYFYGVARSSNFRHSSHPIARITIYT